MTEVNTIRAMNFFIVFLVDTAYSVAGFSATTHVNNMSRRHLIDYPFDVGDHLSFVQGVRFFVGRPGSAAVVLGIRGAPTPMVILHVRRCFFGHLITL
jgi:hypothetical protein